MKGNWKESGKKSGERIAAVRLPPQVFEEAEALRKGNQSLSDIWRRAIELGLKAIRLGRKH